VVLVVPGLFAVESANYRPFFTGGVRGFAAGLPLLFFAYAGFESLAHAAGEVKDSSRRLPRVIWRGVAATTVIFVLMSTVAFGVLPAAELERSATPMADAAGVYLPFGAHLLVTVGALMAVATSLNATMLVPARLGLMLARDGLLPAWVGAIHSERGTPVPALLASFAVMALLLLSGQNALALGIAVLALMLLYGLHAVALLLLPRCNPTLYGQVTVGLPRWAQVAAGLLSVVSMGVLVAVQVVADGERMIGAGGFGARWRESSLTSTELLVLWSVLGGLVYTARGLWASKGDPRGDPGQSE
jgi:amino acid transporter